MYSSLKQGTLGTKMSYIKNYIGIILYWARGTQYPQISCSLPATNCLLHTLGPPVCPASMDKSIHRRKATGVGTKPSQFGGNQITNTLFR